MRRLAIFAAATHHSGVIHKLISSTQKLHFPHNSDGKNIKHHRHLYLLHDPTKIRSLDEAKSFHAFVITSGSFPIQKPVFLYNNFVSKYASFGDIHMARRLFDEMPQRNAVSYNSMISCYSRDGFPKEALGLFSEMRKCDFKPTEFTFGGLLSCQSLGVLEGMQLQALIEKTGLLYVDAFSGTALLGMYARHGCLDEALGIFEFMPKKNLVTWNSMIHVFGQMGYVEDSIFMLSELMRSRVRMSEYTFVSVFTSLEEFDIQLGEQIHGLVIKYGLNDVASVCNCLINMYAKSGATCLAEKMFENAPVKDIVSWNTLIGAMANSDIPAKTFYIFLKMCMTGLSPNEITFANLLNSCSRVHILSYGEYIHAKMIKKRFESDMYTGSALVNLYAKCDKVQEASICFDGITQKNLVSWNSLMLAYSNRDSFSVRLLQEMIHSGYYPNGVSFSIVIKSSLKAELLQLHALTIKTGYHENAFVSSSLISSYARNGLVSDALIFVGSSINKLPVVSSNIIAWIYNQTGHFGKTQELYATVENPDTVSWNILIAACSRNGDYKETFELFDHMRASELCPDNYTFVSLFNVCTKLCNLALGSSLHGLIVKTDFKLCDTFVCNTMIDMYGKCGSLQSSVKIFNEMTKKNIISWTALVSALGLHGHANEALKKFREMERMGIKPDKVAFLSVLSACRHVGLVKQGMDLFSQMKPMYGIEPDIDHYLLVVDLLTGHGHIKEAEQLILGMPIPPNALIWRSFLDGCKKQRTKESLSLAV
ncbi:UNVERIFIED_CONTAM: Pentatricopeptide repeat-containing protein [Sesamum angustifolium]|uniref:Pentatricopeptide repeat-containing protein n=1 Tax=Sesamum angustifolium TaxID=2727405 RepID=A0AAW2J6L9_9LAMI